MDEKGVSKNCDKNCAKCAAEKLSEAMGHTRDAIAYAMHGMRNRFENVKLKEHNGIPILDFSAQQASLFKELEYDAAEICKVFGVPVEMIKNTEGATFNNPGYPLGTFNYKPEQEKTIMEEIYKYKYSPQNIEESIRTELKSRLNDAMHEAVKAAKEVHQTFAESIRLDDGEPVISNPGKYNFKAKLTEEQAEAFEKEGVQLTRDLIYDEDTQSYK